MKVKRSIDKEKLLFVVGIDEKPFLDKVDSLRDVELSIGKWRKLYALLAWARNKIGENVYIYESPNLYDYDVSCHRKYPHLFGDDRTALAAMISPDTVQVKRPKIKTENWYLQDKK
jgi:hypothetical protein